VLRSRLVRQSSQSPDRGTLASPMIRCRSTGESLTLPMPATNGALTIPIPALALNSVSAGGSLTLPSGASTERGSRLGFHSARRHASPSSSSMSPLPQMRFIVTRGGVGTTY